MDKILSEDAPRRPRLKAALGVLWELSWPFLLTLLLSIVLVLFVVQAFGDFEHYRAWQQTHEGALRAWRFSLYAGIAGFWWRLRSKLRASATEPSARRRLFRCDLLALVAVALCELHGSGML
jgi:hypothetical protein